MREEYERVTLDRAGGNTIESMAEPLALHLHAIACAGSVGVNRHDLEAICAVYAMQQSRMAHTVTVACSAKQILGSDQVIHQIAASFALVVHHL